MKHIVITGADGFIGRHFIDKLITCDYEIYAVVYEKSSNIHLIENINNVHIIKGNLDNIGLIKEQIPQNPTAFFHLAWDGVAADKKTDFTYQLKNIEMSLNAVNLASLLKAERFILPGSTSEYAYCNAPINHLSSPSPINAYGYIKVSTRYLCEALCEELELPFVYAVITGIYASDRIDNNIIYYAITSLLKGIKPSFTKLEQLWDYVHIDDAVEALYLIAEHGKNKAFYTIGHGDNHKLSKYIYEIRDIINPDAELGIGDIPYKNGILPSSCVDLTALTADTGFIPRTPFNVGIREIIDTIKNNIKDEL